MVKVLSKPSRYLLAILGIFFFVQTAPCALIDSFDVGGGTLASTSSKGFSTEQQLDIDRVFAGFREIFFVNSAQRSVVVSANSEISGALSLRMPAGSDAYFGVDYRSTAPLDISVGDFNRLQIRFDSISNAATLEIGLNAAPRVYLPISPDSLSYDFSQSLFPSVDFHAIRSIRVAVDSPNGGTFIISNIETVPEPDALQCVTLLAFAGLVWFARQKIIHPDESSTTPHPPV